MDIIKVPSASENPVMNQGCILWLIKSGEFAKLKEENRFKLAQEDIFLIKIILKLDTDMVKKK